MASSLLTGVKRDEKGRNIQVVVRCRPFNTVERKSSYNVIDCDPSRREVLVRTGSIVDKSSKKTYTFDMVFGPAAKQIDVYRSVVCPILDEVIMGYNCTVFAYGQTGTGKTFTMEGERSPDEQFTWEEDPLAGIIPRTLHQIFAKLSENGTEFSVKVSLLEIYNEELFDLLSPSEDVNERLQLFDDPRNKRGVVVKGLEEVTVHNKDEVYHILERGSAKRRTASTLMNAYSSRSHSVFSVTIHMKELTLDGEELVKIGKLNLVDLAGSENIGRSGAVDKRAREAGNINQSLLTLGRVITALVEKRPHVPYRESKLTRILQDSLGGRTKTSIIATVSPSSSNLEETLSTLEYASRAKNIMNKPEVNQKLTKRTLIKEYTEEIERLKRDLAATRDKNGVYLSMENYVSMMEQITANNEHVAEYTERIAAMEDELKKVSELFADGKSQLELCAAELDDKQQRLEETSRDLEATKEKLAEEEFIAGEFHSAQEDLYSTATQLLNTAEASTSDVSGLHAKLDRKKLVEQHNETAQQSFAERMSAAFSDVQRGVQQQGDKHRHVLCGYSQAIGDVLTGSTAALTSAVSGVGGLADGVGRLVGEGVARWQARVRRHQGLSQRGKEVLKEFLEEHQRDMKEVLQGQTLLGFSVLQELTASLRNTTEAQQALADEVEAMKQTGQFFSSLVADLAALREATVQNLNALQDKHDQLEEQIRKTKEMNQKGLKQTIQMLQDQLNLLARESSEDYENLSLSCRALKTPLQNLQESLSSGCSSVEHQASTRARLLCSTSSSLASMLRVHVDESQRVLGEAGDCCERLRRGVSGTLQRDQVWSAALEQHADERAQELLSLAGEEFADAQTLSQSVKTYGAERLSALEEEVRARQEEVKRALENLQSQTSSDGAALDRQQADILERVDASQRLVQNFLLEELRHDMPTGQTPQRRNFVYPRQMAKAASRADILESLRWQQDQLKATTEEEDDHDDDDDNDEESKEEDDDKCSQGSLEDELSACNETVAAEEPFIDENLVFNESKRVPFFKKKKANSKGRKIPSGPKVSGSEATPTPQKSKLPLRCQN
ncbi:kinesin-like protein KIF11 [Phycodurus eques]|uniref:kinesin-like protein KIF11 n=1 Tax=Phycodurus eques TaxID=693459 RepID=UPI002ACE9928|nr:kinesin-like protein KIF11 [Phycodurus eques]XP_061545980.1 kinesin-like protein KIF11 [Phycodurus eques]XP_061545981.1 kinesin-like protein KIF11 [Phycodurus eques]XP_061545982.1 kinesin-like protein KIF11 [Phycodurus eques]